MSQNQEHNGENGRNIQNGKKKRENLEKGLRRKLGMVMQPLDGGISSD